MRNHRNYGHSRPYVASDGRYHVGPPTKTYKCKTTKYTKKKRPTEFHEALFSFGTKDRTSRVSDSEFACQVGSEIGYLVDIIFCSAANILKGLTEIIHQLAS